MELLVPITIALTSLLAGLFVGYQVGLHAYDHNLNAHME